MTATTASVTSDNLADGATATPSLWRSGVVAGAAAAIATTAIVAAARALDVPVETAAGKSIPIAGFAQMTLFFTAVGVLLARVIARRAGQPRSAFMTTTVALTALSVVPDLVLSTGAASKLTLVATHVVAAAIVIPALSSRLSD